ncbi:RNA polymerase sigma factor [Planctomycetota bacterium]
MTNTPKGNREVIADNSNFFRKLYNQYKDLLFMYIQGIVGTGSIAEEILHDVFVSLIKDEGVFERVGNWRPYLYKTARNHALRAYQRQRVESKKLEELRQCRLLAGRDANSEALSTELETCLYQLPVEQREIVLLHVFQDMQLSEIARLTGLPLGTVSSRYRYGLEKLRGWVKL